MTCQTLPAFAAAAAAAARLHGHRQPGLAARASSSPRGTWRDRATTTALGVLAAAAFGAALAAGNAHAAVALQVTLDAPTELQMGVFDRYTVTVNNSGSTTAGSPVARLPLATGQNVAQPLPPGCSIVTEAIPPSQVAVRQIRCSTSTVPARGRRSWSFVLQAPAAPATVQHRAHAVATGSPALWSNTVQTAYGAYSVPITPGMTWLISSCHNGSAGPLAWNLCSPSAEMSGEVVLAVGGVVDSIDGPIGTWLQTDPQSLRIESAPGYGSDPMVLQYSVVNSRCLRGAGESVPPPGGTKTYSASKICRL